MEKIKLEFPGVELHRDKSTIYFKVGDYIQVYVTIKEWTSFFVSIWYCSGDHLRVRFCNVGSIKELREYIEEENK